MHNLLTSLDYNDTFKKSCYDHECKHIFIHIHIKYLERS